MTSYRLYCADAAGHAGHAEALDAANDSQALAIARTLMKGAQKCEIWDGQRLVAMMANSQLRQLAEA